MYLLPAFTMTVFAPIRFVSKVTVYFFIMKTFGKDSYIYKKNVGFFFFLTIDFFDWVIEC